MTKKVVFYLLTLIMLLSIAGAMPLTVKAADIPVSGTISSDTTWTAGNVYVISGNLIIDKDAKLTIEPGTVVKNLGGNRFMVNGELDAQGTSTKPIYFTSYKDDTVGGDTNGDGDATAPGAGDWAHMIFGDNEKATVTMDYCVVRYGGAGSGGWSNDSMIHIQNNSDISITNSEITNSSNTGIKFNGSFTKSPILKGNMICNNTNQGILVNNANPTITENNLSNNGAYGINVSASDILADIAIPVEISKNTFSGNTWSINLAKNAAGTPITTDNVNVGGIRVATNINTDTIWTAGNVYALASNLIIDKDAKLTIEPGTVIKILGGCRFLVNGELDAQGISTKPIYFTSYKDDTVGGDTNGDGDATAPGAGDWAHMIFGDNEKATVTMDYCVVRYGGAGSGGWSNDSMIHIQNNSDISITNSGITNSSNTGIKFNGSFTKSPILKGNMICNNTNQGILVNNANPTITENNLSNNGAYGINVSASDILADIAIPVEISKNTFSGNTWSINLAKNAAGTPITTDNVNVGGIRVATNINTDTIWTAGNVYALASNLIIDKDAKLTIEPGTVIKILGGCRFLVNGELDAQGISTKPIYFTSYKDDTVGGDTNGDGDATAPGAGDWAHMIFGDNEKATVTMDYCVVRYGGAGSGGWSNDSMIHIQNNSDISITNSEITNSSNTGIKFNGSFTKSPILKGNMICNNTNQGILVNNANPTITENNLSNNGAYGINVSASDILADIAIPVEISKNTFSGNTWSINLAKNAAGTPITTDNVNVGGIRVATNINTDTIWTAGNVYALASNLIIDKDAKLTIEPGTVIKILGGCRFLVNGELDAQGISTKPIYFTSYKDDTVGGDTNGDGDATAPGAGDWAHMIFGDNEKATVTMDYCVVRYGGAGSGGWSNDSMIHIQNNSDISITNSEITNSSNTGIKFNEPIGSVKVIGCLLENNAIGQVSGSAVYEVDFRGTPVETLVATATEGTTQDSIKINATTGSGNRLLVLISDNPIKRPDILSAAPTGGGVTDPYTSGSDISGAANKYIGVYVINTSDKVVKFVLLTSAQTPVIETQPGGNSYPYGEMVSALTVEASVSDGGALSYQWYKNDTNDTNTPEEISGATGASYIPDIEATGTTSYYYCIITNTNDKVNGVKTAKLASDIVAVSFIKADRAAPEGLGKTDETAALNDGTITGVTSDMEYKLSTDSRYTPITGTSVTGLAPGIYKVRYIETTNYKASLDSSVTINAVKIASLSVQNGTGGGDYAEGDTVNITANTPSPGKEFDKWTSADGVKFEDANAPTTTLTMPGKAVTVTATYKYKDKVEKIFDKKIGSLTVKLNKNYNSIKASWKKVSGADGYRVYYKASTAKKWSYNNVTNLSWTKKLKAGTKYNVRVLPYVVVDKKTFLSKVTPTIKSVTTLKKTTVSLKKSGLKSVKVSWKDIGGETGYQVYKAISKNGKYKKVKTLSVNKKTWTDKKTFKGKTYYYKVRAYKKVDGKYIYAPFSSVKKIKR